MKPKRDFSNGFLVLCFSFMRFAVLIMYGNANVWLLTSKKSRLAYLIMEVLGIFEEFIVLTYFYFSVNKRYDAWSD